MSRFRNKRVLVLGGAGFLGSHLVRALVKEEASVIVVDNGITGRWENLENIGSIEKPLECLRADISDFAWTKAGALDNTTLDFIVNLASPASPPFYNRFWLETMTVNSVGTLFALDLAAQKKAIFFQASTSEIYSEPHTVPTPESDPGQVDPTSPRSVYDESKRFAETLVYAFHRNCGVDVRVARIFNTYGPGMRLDDGRVVTEFIKAALLNKPIPIFGDGKQTRSFCYVDDLIEGFLLLLLSKETRPVNIGNPYTEMTVNKLAEELQASLDPEHKKITTYKYSPLPQSDPTRRCPDIARAKEALGWEPKVSLSEGLTRTINWAREELKRTSLEKR